MNIDARFLCSPVAYSYIHTVTPLHDSNTKKATHTYLSFNNVLTAHQLIYVQYYVCHVRFCSVLIQGYCKFICKCMCICVSTGVHLQWVQHAYHTPLVSLLYVCACVRVCVCACTMCVHHAFTVANVLAKITMSSAYHMPQAAGRTDMTVGSCEAGRHTAAVCTSPHTSSSTPASS